MYDPLDTPRPQGLSSGEPPLAGGRSDINPGQVSMSYYGIGRPAHPEAGDRGDPHTRQMHWFVPAVEVLALTNRSNAACGRDGRSG